MRELVVVPTARRQFVQIVRLSEARHGLVAADRYRRLIVRTFQMLASDPAQSVARTRAYAPEVLFFHLRHVARSMPLDDRVRQPRHFVVYAYDERRVRIVQLLHDAMDLPAQFD